MPETRTSATIAEELQQGRAPLSAEVVKVHDYESSERLTSTGPRSFERGGLITKGMTDEAAAILQQGRAPLSAEVADVLDDAAA